MRPLPALVLVAVAFQVSCSNFVQSTPFETVDHLRTTAPRSLAEGGHAPRAVPPQGTSWQLGLVGVSTESRRDLPSRHYELDVLLVDRQPGEDAGGRLRLVLENATLVDDEGRSFTPTEVVPKQKDDEAPPRGVRQYLVRFDVPLTYRFGAVARATVHWGVQLGDGNVIGISSRFRL